MNVLFDRRGRLHHCGREQKILQLFGQQHYQLTKGVVIEEGFIQKRRQRSSLLLVGKNCFNPLPR